MTRQGDEALFSRAGRGSLWRGGALLAAGALGTAAFLAHAMDVAQPVPGQPAKAAAAAVARRAPAAPDVKMARACIPAAEDRAQPVTATVAP